MRTVKPEPTPKIGRPERARAEIKTAALKFLRSRPFREMTVNALMEQTSLSRASFYNHFADIYALMEALLGRLESAILEGANPWLEESGDPVAMLHQSLAAEVALCYEWGPLLKAVSDAAGADAALEATWHSFLDGFDPYVSERIAADQALGLIDTFDPALVASALNRANAAMYIREFGQMPRRKPGPVLDAISRLWISSLYGEQWGAKQSSTLQRK